MFRGFFCCICDKFRLKSHSKSNYNVFILKFSAYEKN